MALNKKEPGTKITQPNPDVIRVVEGGGASRIVGILILIGGLLLIYSTDFKIRDIALTVGVLIALFGAAVATQRFTMILDRQRGIWSYGGSVFFVIPFKSYGLLDELGPVCITRRSINPSERGRGSPIITYPVIVRARKHGGGAAELRFGQYWETVEQAREVATPLAEFLNRPIQDDSSKEQ